MKYTQSNFEQGLNKMLAEAKAKDQSRLRVVARSLHGRVVSTEDNRMPMACNAMWHLWRQQGSRKDRIISTTSSGQSTTIEIEFDTV